MKDDLRLNITVMDATHDEFLDILSQMKSCQSADFMTLFEDMIEHTKEHFAFEEDIMDKYNFNDKKEHFDEHINILGEMEYFYNKAKKIPQFGKSYINDYAFEKFKRHVLNVDSQLAMFIKDKNISL